MTRKRILIGLALVVLGAIGATPAFFPSTSFRGLLVDINNVPYSIGTAGAAGSFFPSNQARVLLVDQNNQPYKASSGGSGSVTSIATTAPILGGTITTSGTITCRTATGSLSGCLSAADWTTFNAKQASGNYVTALTGDVTASGPGSAAATLASTAVTPASYTNTNLTVDAKGRITAASNGSAGTSGLTLVEKKTITSNSTTVTFSSLDGNTDEVYLLMARLINNAANTCEYNWRPNADTNNQRSNLFAAFGSGTTNTQKSSLTLGDTGSGSYMSFEIKLFAKDNPNSQSAMRTYSGTFGGDWGVGVAGFVGGAWSDTSTNITSIVVLGSQTNCIGNGSTLALYKYAQQ